MPSNQDWKDASTLLINALGALTVASVRIEGTDEELAMNDLIVRAAELLSQTKKRTRKESARE